MGAILHPTRRVRVSGAVRRVASAAVPYIMAIVVAGLSAVGGFLLAQFFLPRRMTSAEAQLSQIRAEITQLRTADSAQIAVFGQFSTVLTKVSDKLDAGHRQLCIDAREKALAGDRSLWVRLDSAKIDCDDLLGNRIRS